MTCLVDYKFMFEQEDQQPVVNVPTPYITINNTEDVGVQTVEQVDHTQEPHEYQTQNTDISNSDGSSSTSDVDYVPVSSSWDSKESRGRSEFQDAYLPYT